MGASLWRGRGSDEYPKGQKRSLLTSVTANDPRGGVRWSQYVWTPTLNNNIKKKNKKKSVTLSEEYEVEVAGWAGAGVKGRGWAMVGTRLGHLRGLLERKSHAPCLLLPTVVPSFDCDSMNNAWRMGLKEGGVRMEGGVGEDGGGGEVGGVGLGGGPQP